MYHRITYDTYVKFNTYDTEYIQYIPIRGPTAVIPPRSMHTPCPLRADDSPTRGSPIRFPLERKRKIRGQTQRRRCALRRGTGDGEAAYGATCSPAQCRTQGAAG